MNICSPLAHNQPRINNQVKRYVLEYRHPDGILILYNHNDCVWRAMEIIIVT